MRLSSKVGPAMRTGSAGPAISLWNFAFATWSVRHIDYRLEQQMPCFNFLSLHMPGEGFQ